MVEIKCDKDFLKYLSRKNEPSKLYKWIVGVVFDVYFCLWFAQYLIMLFMAEGLVHIDSNKVFLVGVL